VVSLGDDLSQNETILAKNNCFLKMILKKNKRGQEKSLPNK